MSPPDDTAATDRFQEGAPRLLAAVNAATEELAVSATIPESVARLVERFDGTLHARTPERDLASLDPYLVEGLLGGAVVCLKALRHDDLEIGRRDMRLGLEQVRQALRDLVDERYTSGDRPPKQVVQWLDATLAMPQREVAELLGTTARTLQRWIDPALATAPSGDQEARVRVVARITNHLRHSFTAPGVLRWFQRRHPQLRGKSPMDLLDDVGNYPKLVQLAARARSMVAT